MCSTLLYCLKMPQIWILQTWKTPQMLPIYLIRKHQKSPILHLLIHYKMWLKIRQLHGMRQIIQSPLQTLLSQLLLLLLNQKFPLSQLNLLWSSNHFNLSLRQSLRRNRCQSLIQNRLKSTQQQPNKMWLNFSPTKLKT